MYNQKLVASLKANGKILREFKDTVYCPFGAEYSILIKNLNTVRAVVNVYIDGENQTPGGLVLNAHQEVDLERSIKNGNLLEGNRFKFIERTGSVEQHRGVKLEDGLIRIEYQYEIPRPIINVSDNNFWKKDNLYYPPGVRGWTDTNSGTSASGEFWNNATYGTAGASSGSMNINGILRNADYSNGEKTRVRASGATAEYCATAGISSQSEIHDE